MDGMLSQEEINALLSGMDDNNSSQSNTDSGTVGASSGLTNSLTEAEKDVVGEVSNICMGSAATALFSLLNQKVSITAPKVTYSTWNDLLSDYEAPCVFVQIYYKDGIDGNNIFILRENDVKIIADLMMGGDGSSTSGELSELHLSAISEAMNQMMGSAATSMSSILETRIDISPPTASLVNLTDVLNGSDIADFLKGQFVRISFQFEIGNLIKSELMQLYPFDFAKLLNEKFMKYAGLDEMQDFGLKDIGKEEPMVEKREEPQHIIQDAPQPEIQAIPQMQQALPPQMQQAQPQMMQIPPQMMQGGYPQQNAMVYAMPPMQDVNIAPVQFKNFELPSSPLLKTENIDLLLDVPLEVTAELGRTSKSIKEILDFSPGTIIELNRLAGEPVDVLVNGKYVAKGEVVVIEETFGIKVTDVIK